MIKLLDKMNDLDLSGVVDREGMGDALNGSMDQMMQDSDKSMMYCAYEQDPYGKPDRLVRENVNRIEKLTKLSQNEKWDYKAYTDNIIDAAEEQKEKGKNAIAYIEIE